MKNANNEGDEYVSYNNDTNYKFLIRDFTGRVCFGYIEEGLEITEENSISLCFNETSEEEHHFGASKECGGNFSHAVETEYNVTVLYNNVSIISKDRTFQCNFTRFDNSSFVIPYVKYEQAATANYSLMSIGKLDCPRWPIYLPPPPPETCKCSMENQTDQWKIYTSETSSTMTTNVLKNEDPESHSEFFSDKKENCEASYAVNLTDYKDKKVCFGYIKKEHVV